MKPADPPTPSPEVPAPVDILRWCAAATPELWFASEGAAAHRVAREALNEPLRLLREAGLVVVADWVQGRGQGYRLTAAGERVAGGGGPIPLTPPRASESAEGDPPGREGFTAYDRGEITRQAFLAPRPAIISPTLLFACAAWFAVGLYVAWDMGVPVASYVQSGDTRVLLRVGALYGPELARGEWWRLLSAGFVHIGAVHLIANLFSLGMIGPVAEGLWGRKRFLVLYVLSGLGAMCAAALVHPNSVTAGASGAIWGLQSAVIVWLLRFRAHLPPTLFSEWLMRMLLVLGVNVAISFAPGVSWEGHFAGGVVGFVGGVFLDWSRKGAGRRRFAAGVLGIVGLTVGMLGGLVAATYSTPDWRELRARLDRPQPVAPDVPQDLAIRLQPEFVKAFQGVQPARWKQAQTAVTVALVIRKPAGKTAPPETEAMRKAREQLAQVRRDAAEVNSKLLAGRDAQPLREYLAEVTALAEALDTLAGAPGGPTQEGWGRVTGHAERADALWESMTVKPVPPPELAP